jgi:hypothetical protein
MRERYDTTDNPPLFSSVNTFKGRFLEENMLLFSLEMAWHAFELSVKLDLWPSRTKISHSTSFSLLTKTYRIRCLVKIAHVNKNVSEQGLNTRNTVRDRDCLSFFSVLLTPSFFILWDKNVESFVLLKPTQNVPNFCAGFLLFSIYGS